MHQANPLSFLHFQIHGSLFSAFSKLSYSSGWWLRWGARLTQGCPSPSCGAVVITLHLEHDPLLHGSIPCGGCYSHELISGGIYGGVSWAYTWGQGWTLQAEGPEKFPQAFYSTRGLGERWLAPIPASSGSGLCCQVSWAWSSAAGSGNQCGQPAVFYCGPMLVLAGVVGNLSVLLFSSTLSNQKSFDTCKPFTKGQFLINKLNHLSSPK